MPDTFTPTMSVLADWERTSNGVMYTTATAMGGVALLHSVPYCSGMKNARMVPNFIADELWRLGQDRRDRFIGWCEQCAVRRKASP